MAVGSALKFLWPFGRRSAPEEDGYFPLTATVVPHRDAHSGRGRPDFPTFRASALDRPLDKRREERREITRARFALGTYFTPTQPVADRSSFAGRLGVLARLISAIESQRSHVVLYGERGIGKTSLLHVLSDVARESSYIVSYATCGANANFPDLFRAVLEDVPLLFHRGVAPNAGEAESGGSIADRLPKGAFGPAELADLCTEITGTRVLIILDEYDRVTDSAFRQQVAEFIKNLSDRSARVQLVIAGVASNLQELIGYVPSIRRNVIGLPMPRLEETEVQEMIALGEAASGVRFDPDLTRIIHLLALGSPYLARLLCHHAALEALDQGRLTVDVGHLSRALDQAILEIEGRMAPRTVVDMRKFVGGRYDPLVAALAEASRSVDSWFDARTVVDLLPGAPVSAVQVEQELATLAGQLGLEAEMEDGVRRFRFTDDSLPVYLWLMVGRLRLDSGTLEEALATA
ncbi:ATP-binding protein [Sphingomonas elodea]|uniref:GelJ n=1 Tax=Sphingomonas elodea TaxID=179878 RepID=Q7X2M1_SPHEL|nr:ATP-binding protein [Sphingomonas elodea]AAP57688.1 GelJ [Sphingomonas elodea ATCC 31461]